MLEPSAPTPDRLDYENGMRAVDARTFVFDRPADPPSLWGDAPNVLWAAGQSLVIAGAPGACKTTLAQNLALARLRGDPFLGMRTEPIVESILYVAADRPSQVRASLGRMVVERDPVLERFLHWPGLLPFDLAASPETLAEFALYHQAEVLIIDSLKDVALDLTKDEVGARVNRAVQATLQAGVEIVVLHHSRKATQTGVAPTHLDDVYGSTWITAGAGSVLLLLPRAGGASIELRHLKPPVEPVDSLKLLHDRPSGSLRHQQKVDLRAAVVANGDEGLTAKDAACLEVGGDPTSAQVRHGRLSSQTGPACRPSRDPRALAGCADQGRWHGRGVALLRRCRPHITMLSSSGSAPLPGLAAFARVEGTSGDLAARPRGMGRTMRTASDSLRPPSRAARC